MPVPIIYRKGDVRPEATYDYFDIAARTGYKRFYGINSELSGGIVYNLVVNAVDVSEPYIVYSTADDVPSYIKAIDLDYDLTFNAPQIISGNAYLTYTMQMQSSITRSPQAYVSVFFYNVNAAGVEKQIGHVCGNPRYVTGNPGSFIFRDCLKAVLSKQKFSIGEKLRVTLEVWVKSGGEDGNTIITLYLDATNRTSVANTSYATITADDTDFKIDIPFYIDA